MNANANAPDRNAAENSEKWGDVRRVLGAGSVEEKLSLLQDLQETDDPSIVEPLLDILEKEKNRAVKARIFLVLNHALPLSGFGHVERMLRSPDPFVRNGAVDIIKRNEIPLLKFFDRLAEDENKDVRKFVIDSLSQEKSSQAIEIIRRRLLDNDINIAYTAIEYLGNFRDQGSVPCIEDVLFASDNMMIICSSLEALAKIGVSTRPREVVARFGGDRQSLIVFSLLKYLAAFGTIADLPYIEAIMAERANICLKEAIDALAGILARERLQAPPASLCSLLNRVLEQNINQVDRYAISKLLAHGADSLAMARQMLAEEDVMTRLSAIEILAETGDESDIGRLERMVAETDSDELLEAVGDAVIKIRDRLLSEV